MDDRLFADNAVSRIKLKWRCGRFETCYRSVSLWIIRRNKQLPLWRRTDECEVETAAQRDVCEERAHGKHMCNRSEEGNAAGDSCVAPDGRVRARHWEPCGRKTPATWMQFDPEYTALWTSAESRSLPPCVYIFITKPTRITKHTQTNLWDYVHETPAANPAIKPFQMSISLSNWKPADRNMLFEHSECILGYAVREYYF